MKPTEWRYELNAEHAAARGEQWSPWMSENAAMDLASNPDHGTGRVQYRDARPRNPIHIEEYNARGFTLVEMLIVVVIVGILAAIAIPAYSAMCDRAREAGVKANMHNYQLAGESFMVGNDGEYGSADQVMASEDAPHFENPFTHGAAKGDAWEGLRRCGDAPTATRGIVAVGGDAFGFWVHGMGSRGTEILVLKSGEVVMDSVDPAADPLPGPGVTQ